MNTIGLFYNTGNLAVTQFDNMPFNGFGIAGGEAFAVNQDGIYQLFSGQLDDQTFVNSLFALGPTDFGDTEPKRVRTIEIGCRCSGTLSVTVSDEEGRSFTKTGITNTNLFIPEVMIIKGNRNVRGRYLTFTFENVDGCDFELLEVKVILTGMRQVKR